MGITLRTVSVCLFSQWTVWDVELVDQDGDYTEKGKYMLIFTMAASKPVPEKSRKEQPYTLSRQLLLYIAHNI